MNLHDLERRYLCGVMNGGDLQNITLSVPNEGIHQELKRLRESGYVKIPGVIPGTDSVMNLDIGPAWAEYFADLIRAEQKKSRIRKLCELAKDDTGGDIIDRMRAELDKIADETGRTGIVSSDELKQAEYENTEFIIKDILPVGLTLLIGAPKMGKSWLTLLMAECITSNFPLFGYSTRKAGVLYYTLEDGIRQCKYRLNKIGSLWDPHLYFCGEVRGVSEIMAGIRVTRARVVFIDTFIAFAGIEDNNSYSETTDKVRELKRIADTLNVAIVIVHHKRKTGVGKKDWMEGAIGSQGLVAAADCVISLERERGKKEAVLLLSGRSVSDRHIDICWDDCVWVKK